LVDFANLNPDTFIKFYDPELSMAKIIDGVKDKAQGKSKKDIHVKKDHHGKKE